MQLELPGAPPGRRPTSSRASTTSRRCSPAPVLAVAANSPLLFGSRLWAETRIALFQQSVDTRSQRSTTCASSEAARQLRHALGQGARSSRSSARTSRASARWSAPTSTRTRWRCSTAASVPQLKALRLHNGTIYRWNRACYGITERQAAPAHREPRDAVRPERRSTRSRTPRSGSA